MKHPSPPAEGIVAQLLFIAAAIMGSRGAIRAGIPIVDDEGRDVEVHLGGKFSAALAIQVKVSTVLFTRQYHHQLRIARRIRRENIVDHPRYWYFLAHLDLERMAFSEYVFLVPSKVVHRHCHRIRGVTYFVFEAGMSDDSHDTWTPYRHKLSELGPFLEQLIREAPEGLPLDQQLVKPGRIPGMLWLGAGKRGPVSS